MNTETLSRVKKRLLESYSPDETGLWRVLGEDPNCDMGGPHIQPELGYFEGRYGDIVMRALILPSFVSWGAGGDIKKVAPVKIDAKSVAEAKKLRAEKKTLEKKLQEINDRLEELP